MIFGSLPLEEGTCEFRKKTKVVLRYPSAGNQSISHLRTLTRCPIIPSLALRFRNAVSASLGFLITSSPPGRERHGSRGHLCGHLCGMLSGCHVACRGRMAADVRQQANTPSPALATREVCVSLAVALLSRCRLQSRCTNACSAFVVRIAVIE